MGKRTSYEPGVFCWVELSTTDPDAAKDFYGELLGWEYRDDPLPDGGMYTTVLVQGDAAAAVQAQPQAQREAGAPPNWFSYVTVDDADATAKQAAELGGSVHAGPFDVMDSGRMAVIADPTGAMFGAWQPGVHFGAQRVNDPGCLTMNELATSDVARASEFYSALLGWRFEPVDTGGGPPYWSIRHDGAAGGLNGGARELAGEQAAIPPHWMPYFTVTSVDEALAKVSGKGGTTLFGPVDIPAGRFAAIDDPQGAGFAIFEGGVDD